jgi:hypothetical protein
MLTSCTNEKKHLYVYRPYIMDNEISLLQSIVTCCYLEGDSGFVASKRATAANQPDTPRLHTFAKHTPLPCQAQYRPHMNHTTQEVTRSTATTPANHIFYKTSHRKKQDFTETRLSYNTARNIHHRALRGPQIQNHPPFSDMALTIDCNNEISLSII